MTRLEKTEPMDEEEYLGMLERLVDENWEAWQQSKLQWEKLTYERQYFKIGYTRVSVYEDGELTEQKATYQRLGRKE